MNTTMKDIETAPKDGTMVLLVHPSYESLPLAFWEDSGLEDEDGQPAYAWICKDTNFQCSPIANAGVIWEDDQNYPTHWIDIDVEEFDG